MFEEFFMILPGQHSEPENLNRDKGRPREGSAGGSAGLAFKRTLKRRRNDEKSRLS